MYEVHESKVRYMLIHLNNLPNTGISHPRSKHSKKKMHINNVYCRD